MRYTDGDIERFMANFMKEDDTFKFDCKICGDCCRNRQEPIMLTGYDVFRLSRALKLKPIEFIKRHTEWYVGANSHLPVVILNTKNDGSCTFLRKAKRKLQGDKSIGKCKVHDDKPIVCAIYPLGRMFIAGEEENFGYFQQPLSCGLKSGKEHTLKEWLEKFRVYEWDEASILWAKTIARCAMTMKDIKQDSALFEQLITVLLNVFYVAYDIEKDYLEQFKSNIEKKEIIFKKVEIQL